MAAVFQIRTQRGYRGYTLLEVLTVVVIVGVLAAVAVPAMIKYVRRAKTAEAEDKISLMNRGAIVYVTHVSQQVNRGGNGTAILWQFPSSEGPTPVDRCCVTFPTDGVCITSPSVWDTPSWQSLDFGVTDPHRYQYQFVSGAGGVGDAGSSRALGDLDCDGTTSLFERAAMITGEATVRSARGIYRYLPDE